MTVTGNVFYDPLSGDFPGSPLIIVSEQHVHHVKDSKAPLQLQILPAEQSATNNRYIVATVGDTPKPLYWWAWMDGGIKVIDASGYVAGDIGAIKQDQIQLSDVVCQLTRKGMLSSKWVFHDGASMGGKSKQVLYQAKDKPIKGKQLELIAELVAKDPSATAHPLIQSVVNGAGNKMAVHVDKQVAARATREGQLEIAPGVDVVGAIAALALAHNMSRFEGRRFFEWEGTALRLMF